MARPLLETDRLRLYPLTAAHTDALVELDADAEVMRFLTGRASTREEVVSTWMPRRTDPGHDARGLGYWVAFDGPMFLGWFCLTPWRDDPAAGELGYRLRRTAWGRGYAMEGARTTLAHGFETVGLGRVVAETMAVNTRSRRVLDRLGMRHVATEVREWDEPLPGAERGEAVYELRRQDWPDAGRGTSVPSTGNQ